VLPRRRATTRIAAMSTLVASGALALSACGDEGDAAAGDGPSLPQGSESVELDPAEFTTAIDNPYWPMAPGSRWVYREAEGGSEQRVVVTVTERTKTIANGIEARVVRDVVSEDGEPVEITDDWYAQDSAGNIWYLGEKTAEYEHGEVTTTAGSFEAGVDGAEAGIAMPAQPEVGMSYRQEYYAGEAEDWAEILSTGEQAQVSHGHFTDVLVTKDLAPLEPKVLELKFYAPDVGPVLALGISGGAAREELVSYTPGG
jgi:hypothetical protein